jgi:branched-chain amino acid transport system ATP-binding protein
VSTLDSHSTVTADTVLEVRDVQVSFGAVVALNGASLALRSGTITGLIGANGAGKSVLLDVITGFLKPRAGSIRLGGAEIARRSVASRARLGIRRTFQSAELFDDLSVRENVSVGARRGLDVGDFLDRNALSEWADELAQNLPTGIRRRVDVARALAGKPKLLLLDEPGAGLSGAEVSQLADWLRAVAADSVGVLVVDHDMALIGGVCEQVSVLDFGQVIAEGSPDDVLRDDTVRKAYLGG